MDALSLLKQQAASARRELNGVMADVDQQMAHWQPPGVANPIDDLLLHVIMGQDRQLSRITGKPALLEEWAARLGLPADWRHTPEASRTIPAGVDALKQYSEAVFGMVDAYLDGLKDADLDEMREGFRGPTVVALLLSNILVTHVYEHAGEIASIKGLQGAKGYATG